MEKQQLPRLYASKVELLNRERRRKFIDEATHIEEWLGEVERRFYVSLFMDGEETSYNDVYTFYLDQFQHNLKAYRHHHCPRITNINDNFFCEAFHPMESEQNPLTLKDCLDEIVQRVKRVFVRERGISITSDKSSAIVSVNGQAIGLVDKDTVIQL